MRPTETPDLSKKPDDAFITSKELAVLTGYSPLTVKLWRQRGRGPKATIVGTRPRYRVSDVKAWLAGQAA